VWKQIEQQGQSMTNTVVALDPGLTIGICILHEDDSYEHRQFVPAQYPHPHEMLFDILSEINPKVVVYERFDFRAAKNGAVLTGVEYIGVIELYAQIKCLEIFKISPSDGKAFWTDNKLRLLGMYKRGMPHANDATRILNTWRMKAEPSWKDETVETLRSLMI
jgi:hypothetical protein